MSNHNTTPMKINMSVYFVGSWLFSVFLCTGFLHGIPNDTLRDQLHSLLAVATYGLIYQFPAIIAYWLLRKWRAAAIGLAVTLSALCHLFVFFDGKLYDLYGFHINGFVWNLLTSRGGIESLGADQTNITVVIGYLTALAAIHLSGLLLSRKLSRVRIPAKWVILLFFVATVTERGVYGYSRAELYEPMLARGGALPLYQPTKMNSFLNRLGIQVKKSSAIQMRQKTKQLKYPRQSLVLSKNARPFNILVLVSESLRWDMLNPEVMPNMSRFAKRGWNYTAHYSGGNGTRQGLFALFYGISGNNWDTFLRNRKGPVFFDVLKDYNYQYFIYTSAKFTYPEFDLTIFSQIPKDKLVENNNGEPWMRDEANTSALIDSIKHRDPAKPYLGFMFYEATHARYSFPNKAAINPNYATTLDYAGLSREDLASKIKGLKARYENAAHSIDSQLQRIVEYLQKSGDLNNTLVIITGDHGEEFMERGRWGHNSAFTDWQVRVPMIAWMPGSTARTISMRTSHMDVVPTILKRLGVQNQVKDYSQGIDLSAPQDHRNIIVASWSDIGLINDYGKLVIPYKSTTQHENLATNLNDKPVNGSALVANMRQTIFQVLTESQYN